MYRIYSNKHDKCPYSNKRPLPGLENKIHDHGRLTANKNYSDKRPLSLPL